MNARIEASQRKLDAQSDKIDRLLEAFEHLHNLMRADMEYNMQALEVLGDTIREQHAHTRRRLARSGDLPGPVWALPPDAAPRGTEKLLVGEAEKVRLTPPGRVFHARIDTGATTSSLDARDIESFERDGNAWVRFKVPNPAGDSLCEMEQPVIRHARIIQPAMQERDRRPVVKLQIQLGPMRVIEEFTLVDRRDLPYQVLIGRNILRDLIIVDVAQRFIVPLPESGN